METKRYLTNAFSPVMLAGGTGASVQEINLTEARYELRKGFKSAVYTQATADMLSGMIKKPVPLAESIPPFKPLDRVVCIVPDKNKSYRCFLAIVTGRP